MDKVYIVLAFDWDYFDIRIVYKDRNKAERYIKKWERNSRDSKIKYQIIEADVNI